MPYEVLNARVKQKINTEAQWIAEEDEFGVIFEGEQAFVYNETGQAVNFKIGDGTKKFSELPYFIAYYSGVTNQKVLSWINTTSNITVPDVFKNNSLLTDLVFYNSSGSDITLKVGTTNGGSELFQVTVPVGASSIECKYPFSAVTTLYLTGITGKECSVFMLFFQMDEAPAIPPTGSGGGASFVYGTVYSFIPMYPGHENYAWNFTDNTGKTGTPYEGCTLLADMDETYLIGYKIGQNIGGSTGSNALTLAKSQLPNEGLGLFSSEVNHSTGDIPGDNDIVARARNSSTAQHLNYEISRATTFSFVGKSQPMGDGQPIDKKPKSKIVLYFTGPATT